MKEPVYYEVWQGENTVFRSKNKELALEYYNKLPVSSKPSERRYLQKTEVLKKDKF